MDATRFGLFVAEMRKENHMTQAELATKIKVTDKAVSRWERGDSPGRKAAAELMGKYYGLGYEVEDLSLIHI